MFLKNPRLLWKSGSFRLITMYTLLFIVCSVGINLYIYSFISSYIHDQSREEIRGELAEYIESYEQEGLELLTEELREDELERDAYYVRLVGTGGTTIVESVPVVWEDFDPEEVRGLDYRAYAGWTVLESRDSDAPVYEFTSAALVDGGVIQVGHEVEEREELLADLRRIYLLFLIPLVLIAYLGAVYMADQSLNPIREILRTLNSIVKSGRVDERVALRTRDEVHTELINMLNAMLERIELLLAGMRGALDSIAHDLRTPLARLRGSAEIALVNPGDVEQLRETVSDCIEESDRIVEIFNTLLDISAAESGAIKLDKTWVNVTEVINEVTDIYSIVAEEKGLAIENNLPAEVFAAVDRRMMRQVFANLLDNAVKYTEPGGEVRIDGGADTDTATISVSDTGVGVAEAEQKRVWERLYRSDISRSHEGYGLGLSLVRAVVGAHGGSVELESAPEKGSVFTVTIPVGEAGTSFSVAEGQSP